MVPSFPFATAMRRAIRQGYGWTGFRSDVSAGLVVGVVAVPLSMALAIAVGAPPQHGLYTAAVAGGLAALAGGSKFQVTGPTAAFIVVLAPITAKYGLSGLLCAGLMAGLILICMALARLGQWIQFIPHPVTTGFTAGIAVVIALLQIKDIFGLRTGPLPSELTERVSMLVQAWHTVSGTEFAVAASTFALLLVCPKIAPRVPAALVALTVVSLGGLALRKMGFAVDTIGTRFTAIVDGVQVAGIPPRPPSFALPWSGPMTVATVRELFPHALTIALLGAIESLLSAVVADGMTGKKHDPDAELMGQGLANVVAPFFGGIAATGALARTATNIRAGAISPIASVIHSAFVFLSIVLFAPLVAHVPMAALAALLLSVAVHMSEARHFVYILRVAPRSDVAVLLTCFTLTVVMDMVVAITVGVVLAALLFMRRMSEFTGVRILGDCDEHDRSLPEGVLLYEISGPMFFGAAQRAISALGAVHDSKRVVVLSLANVGVIDATGFVALESALVALRSRQKFVIISGPLPEPRRMFERAQLEASFDHVLMAASEAEALEVAADLAKLNPQWQKRDAALSTRPPTA